MKKIKIVGILIFMLSMALALLFNYINYQNNIQSSILTSLNQQKDFIQEISKNIFYIYKNENSSTKELDNSIKKNLFRINTEIKTLDDKKLPLGKQQKANIIHLRNKFYNLAQTFMGQVNTTSVYSTMLLQELVNDIYNTNLQLVFEINKLNKMHQLYFSNKINAFKAVQDILFILLALSLIYLFTQLKSVIDFVQKFLLTSKNIITNSTIQGLKPIKIYNNIEDVTEATNNFNFLVNKINKSVKNSTELLQHTYESLEIVENNIEDILELLALMEKDKDIDHELTKKEDSVINSLEELTNSTLKLKNLKIDLDNLISTYNLNKSK
ncbi:hypothetical protein [Sulfurimonas sp. HSL-1716]|uniref:hypothetical protein n=1 Tax=Hydrocurvibacter sulfurireducens TaxID=3131937 RepID=UPI0031F89C36